MRWESYCLAFLQLRKYEIENNCIPGKRYAKKNIRGRGQNTPAVKNCPKPKGVISSLSGFLVMGEWLASRGITGTHMPMFWLVWHVREWVSVFVILRWIRPLVGSTKWIYVALGNLLVGNLKKSGSCNQALQSYVVLDYTMFCQIDHSALPSLFK